MPFVYDKSLKASFQRLYYLIKILSNLWRTSKTIGYFRNTESGGRQVIKILFLSR